jgi:hypothetical protein
MVGMEEPAQASDEASDDRLLLKPSQRSVWLGLPIAALAIGFVVSLAVGADRFARPTRTSGIVLLYVGAEDCAPCRAWQKDERPGLLASVEFPHIHYREIKSPTLIDVLKDENWPEELRPYRSQLKPSDGVPLWLIVSDDQLVERQFGAAAWREIIVPKLRRLVQAEPG